MPEKKKLKKNLRAVKLTCRNPFAISRETVIEDAQKKSVNIMADAERQAARLMQIKNDNLKTIVSNCLHRILPG